MKHRIGTTLVLLLLTGSCVPRAQAQDLQVPGQTTNQPTTQTQTQDLQVPGQSTSQMLDRQTPDSMKARNHPIRN